MPYSDILLTAAFETIYMVIAATIFSVLIGFILAIILVVTNERGLKPNNSVHKLLEAVINTLRSFPFVILMIFLFPLTRIIAGTTIGTTATIVPLTLAAAPFAARVIESALMEVDYGIIEAAESFGANTFQIIFIVMIKF